MFLPDELQRELRRINKISDNEVLKKEGDLFVAINVVNQQRRIVDVGYELIERLNKQNQTPIRGKEILKG